MKLAIASDLHLEFGDCELLNTENAEVLILSGDILVVDDLRAWDSNNLLGEGTKSQRWHEFMQRCSNLFPQVIFIMGNHEHYHGNFSSSARKLREFFGYLPNVHILDRETRTVGDVTFIGGTLWTDMNKGDPLTLHAVRDMMNDFRIIKKELEGYTNLKPHDTVIRHRHMLDYIKTVVAERGDEKFVVCGHHSPSFQSVHESYKSEYLMNGAYHSDLSEFILDRPQIKLWTHGHTHHCFDYMIGETRIVCNPRGYESDGYSEDTGWNPNLVLEI